MASAGGLSAAAAVLLMVAWVFGTAAAASASIWPPRPDDLLWRVVLISQGINGIGNAVTGVGIAALVGFVCSRGWLLRMSALTAALLAILTAAGLLLLVLDYLQVRGALVPGTRAQWDLTIVGAMIIGAFGFGVLAVVGWASARLAGAAQLRRG